MSKTYYTIETENARYILRVLQSDYNRFSVTVLSPIKREWKEYEELVHFEKDLDNLVKCKAIKKWNKERYE